MIYVGAKVFIVPAEQNRAAKLSFSVWFQHQIWHCISACYHMPYAGGGRPIEATLLLHIDNDAVVVAKALKKATK